MAVGLQNHVHISTVLEETGEEAPTYAWVTIQADEIPNVIVSIKRSLTGKLYRHVLSSGGVPVQFKDYHLVVKLYAYGGLTVRQQLALFEGWNGKAVYFVPHYHPADNEDHGDYVREMVLQLAAPPQWIDTGQSTALLEVQLTDADTV